MNTFNFSSSHLAMIWPAMPVGTEHFHFENARLTAYAGIRREGARAIRDRMAAQRAVPVASLLAYGHRQQRYLPVKRRNERFDFVKSQRIFALVAMIYGKQGHRHCNNKPE